jgi:signal transduction histidine kinase
VAGDGDLHAWEKRYIRRDGRTTWVNLTVALVRDRTGQPRYFITAAEPIDARKAGEEELRDAVRARDEFLHIASHELRTPLTSLCLQLGSLKRAASRGAAEPDRVAAKADAALRQQARLARLVDELLDVSRLDLCEFRVAAREADLAATVRAVAEREADAASRTVPSAARLAGRVAGALRSRGGGACGRARARERGQVQRRQAGGRGGDMQGEAALVVVRDRASGSIPRSESGSSTGSSARLLAPLRRPRARAVRGAPRGRGARRQHRGGLRAGRGRDLRIELPLSGPEAPTGAEALRPASVG